MYEMLFYYTSIIIRDNPFFGKTLRRNWFSDVLYVKNVWFIHKTAQYSYTAEYKMPFDNISVLSNSDEYIFHIVF